MSDFCMAFGVVMMAVVYWWLFCWIWTFLSLFFFFKMFFIYFHWNIVPNWRVFSNFRRSFAKPSCFLFWKTLKLRELSMKTWKCVCMFESHIWNYMEVPWKLHGNAIEITWKCHGFHIGMSDNGILFQSYIQQNSILVWWSYCDLFNIPSILRNVNVNISDVCCKFGQYKRLKWKETIQIALFLF